MALLFISSLVPDQIEYQTASFTRSGNNVLLGIATSLPEDTLLISCRPVPSFPSARIWIKGEYVRLDEKRVIHILPTLNIKIIKNVFWGLLCSLIILKWTTKNKHEERNVLVYNIYTPLISTLYHATKLFGCRLYAILYDLGIPPKHLNLGYITMFGYKVGEYLAKRYIPKLAGRIVINERIVDYYAPGKNYLLIDGGINDSVIQSLFPLEMSTNERLTCVLAGMLWSQNGTELILDTLRRNIHLNVKFIFAGNGNDVKKIIAASEKDNRIEYAGMLSMAELFVLYKRADVLVNLRIEEEVDFHFPSKLLEYMATGRYVVSTPIAHAERDYSEYVDFLHDISTDGLARKLSSLICKDKRLLLERGIAARKFMVEKRNWAFRTTEIINYINNEHK